MTKAHLTLIACTLALFAIPAMAQPPGGPGGGPGGRGGPGGGGSNNAVLSAIDADGNHEISAAEMKNAMTSLATLDTNKDGKLVSDEIHPERTAGGDRGGPGGGRGGRGGPGGPGGGRPDFAERIWEFDSNKDGKLSSEELPERMRTVLARYDDNKNGTLEKAEIEKMVASREREGGPGGRGGRGGERGGFGDRGGRGGGPPSPEQLVTDAMEFDADKDGKLSKAELTKFAQEFASRGPQGGGPGGGRGAFGDRGGRGGGGGGDRPQRPARPE